jgi:glutathione S-transferase
LQGRKFSATFRRTPEVTRNFFDDVVDALDTARAATPVDLYGPYSGIHAMIIVHHLNNSRSQRILWLLEELGADYEVRRYERNPATMLAPPALRQVHPLGKSPVIADGNTIVAESGAIVEYLLDRFDSAGRLRPPSGTPEHLRYRFWLHFAEGSAMPPQLLSLVMRRMATAPMPFFVRPVVRMATDRVMSAFVQPQLDAQYAFIEAELGKRQWLAGGAFSAADVQMSFPLEAASARTEAGARHPALRAYVERLHARPAYARALQRGGAYKLG